MLERILDFLGAHQDIWGFGVLMLAAATEYVFPPFPGDMVLLVGGVLVAAQGWSPVFVFVAVTLGAVGGSMGVYGVGVWIERHPESWIGRWLRSPRLEKGVLRVVGGFKKHGAIYLAVNRFLPGIRAFFFLAAGLGRLPWRHVLFWGAASAAVWNALVIVAGYAVGGNLDAMQRLFEQYTTAAWTLIGVVVAFFVGRTIWRRWRGNEPPPEESAPEHSPSAGEADGAIVGTASDADTAVVESAAARSQEDEA